MRFLFLMLFSVSSYSAVIYWDDGTALNVPESTWEVKAVPKGFNTAPYSESNPKGMLPGFQGWPEYESCKGQLTLGGVCEEPYFITPPPKLRRQREEFGGLSLGG